MTDDEYGEPDFDIEVPFRIRAALYYEVEAKTEAEAMAKVTDLIGRDFAENAVHNVELKHVEGEDPNSDAAWNNPPCLECGYTGPGEHPYPCGNWQQYASPPNRG